MADTSTPANRVWGLKPEHTWAPVRQIESLGSLTHRWRTGLGDLCTHGHGDRDCGLLRVGGLGMCRREDC